MRARTLALIALLQALPAAAAGLTPLEQAGKKIFFDTNLSTLRNQSCATCHGPEAGYSGSFSDRFGNRRPPSVAYVSQSPVLSWDKEEEVFVGGAFWDGRATGKRLRSTAAEQAQGPFLNPVEHGFADAACVVSRVCAAPYGTELRALHPDLCAAVLPADIDERCANDGYTAPLTAAERRKVDKAFDAIALAVPRMKAPPRSTRSRLNSTLGSRARPG